MASEQPLPVPEPLLQFTLQVRHLDVHDVPLVLEDDQLLRQHGPLVLLPLQGRQQGGEFTTRQHIIAD